MSDVSTDTVVSNFNAQVTNHTITTPIARALNSRCSDFLNVTDYGVTMSGADDSSYLQNLYNATTTSSSFYVPSGILNVPSFSSSASKAMYWDFLGEVRQGSMTGPQVTTFGDGDVVKTFANTILQFTKNITNSTAFQGNTAFTLNNNSGTQFSSATIVNNVVVTAISTENSYGQIWNLGSYLTAGSAQGAGAIGIVSYTYKPYGSTQTIWQYYGHTDDMTGLPGGSSNGNVIGTEQDIAANGPEIASTSYNPTGGSRNIMQLKAHAYTNTWLPSHAYSLGQLVTPVTSPLYVYICTTAGTSSGTEPIWPTTPGSMVTDGTVTWTIGTTIASQISRALQIGSDTNASIGTGIVIQGAIYGAGLDLAGITVLTGATNVSAMRLPPNLGIDFSSLQTSTSVHKRVLVYDSTSGNLEYQFSGAAVFSITDNGGFLFCGPTIDNSTVIQTATSGSTLNIPAGCSTYVIQGSGPLATLTVNMPSNAVPNQIIKIIPQVAITALTLRGNGNPMLGAPSSATIGTWIQKQLAGGSWS